MDQRAAIVARTGLKVSAIRFYEDKGLVEPWRTNGNQRRFPRSDIRRLSFIMIAQKLGLSLSEIEEAMKRLPQGRTPNAADWKRISGTIRRRIDAQIAQLEKVREDLDGCIGCGCLRPEEMRALQRRRQVGRDGQRAAGAALGHSIRPKP